MVGRKNSWPAVATSDVATSGECELEQFLRWPTICNMASPSPYRDRDPIYM